MLWDLFRIFAADLQNRTMIGTIVNATTIIVGSIIGSLLHRGVKEKYKEVLYTGLGLASLAIGLNATISHFPQSQYPVLFIISLASSVRHSTLTGGSSGSLTSCSAERRTMVIVWPKACQQPFCSIASVRCRCSDQSSLP